MHGGQLRASNIVGEYRKNGHQVQVIGVQTSTFFDETEDFDPVPEWDEMAAIIPDASMMEDAAIALLYADNDHYYEQLEQKITNVPDVIHAEQPWLFGFAQRYAQKHQQQDKKIKIIYGSQNIEYKLKEAIVSNYDSAEQVKIKKQSVKQIELNTIKQADAIICVSKDDQEWIESQLENSNTNTVLSPNGVTAWQADDNAIITANELSQGNKFALFCGSAHRPNIKGFFDMFSSGLGSLAYDEKLIIVGGAGGLIEQNPKYQQSAKLSESVIIAGLVEQECLFGLLDTAHCILLPITQGGGTNLKTAEAIWAGHHVIATKTAMRGFEEFIGMPGINVVEDSEPEQFKQQFRKVMQLPPIKIDNEQRELRRSVLWPHYLKPLSELVLNLNNKQAPS